MRASFFPTAKLGLIFVFSALASGCAWLGDLWSEDTPTPAPPPTIAHVEGQVLYRERVLPPPGAVLRASLQDVSRADAKADIIADETKPLPVRAPPFDFKLSYDAARIDTSHRYVVRAEIRDADGKPRFTTTTSHPVITGGAPNIVEIVLQAVGAPPVAVDPWREAKARGVTFRGLGQEPGWLVEITEGRKIELVLEYGGEKIVTPAPEPQALMNGWRYFVEDAKNPYTLDALDRPCTDAMSGEAFPVEVIIHLPGRTLNGCGRRL